jgi:hypothetical protein
VIRNVCIHVNNEQPLLADLYDRPSATDAGLLCTNVRTLDGKRPVFIDRTEATFFFPYHVIRFIEIPVGALDGRGPSPVDGAGESQGADDPGTAFEMLPDEQRLPVPVAAGAVEGDDPSDDLDLEIDEQFLQRIRDI